MTEKFSPAQKTHSYLLKSQEYLLKSEINSLLCRIRVEHSGMCGNPGGEIPEGPGRGSTGSGGGERGVFQTHEFHATTRLHVLLGVYTTC